MKKNNPDDQDTWINALELDKNSSRELIRHIKNQPLVGKAFTEYLNDLGNVAAFSLLCTSS
jgi:hypothetical protein